MVVLVVAANTRVTGSPSIKMDQVMVQPCPCLPKKDQRLISMMTIQHRDNIVLHMDHSQVHNSIGS